MRFFARRTPPDAEVSLLVVYVNFGVGRALAQRLLDSYTVTFARVGPAIEALEGDGRHDAVLLCPYLAPGEREALLAAAGRRRAAPPVFELVDHPAGGPQLHVAQPAGRGRGQAAAALLSGLRALAVPTAA